MLFDITGDPRHQIDDGFMTVGRNTDPLPPFQQLTNNMLGSICLTRPGWPLNTEVAIIQINRSRNDILQEIVLGRYDRPPI